MASVVGLKENVGELSPKEISRLQYLLGYYIDGWGGFPDNPDRYEQRVMDSVQHLFNNANINRLSPEELEMARLVLNYGQDEQQSGKDESLCVYFDYTGAGRGPEPIAGPFTSREEADAWVNENGYRGDQNVFVDVCRKE